ncbi:MAG TPA: NosD domain-containing protein [Streptosporangiaceae bacterium]
MIIAACAAGLGIALGSGVAASASVQRTIVVGPGQSIQAAVDQASPGDTVLVEPGVYHQSVQIRTDGITLRGSGDFRGGTVLVPPATFPKTPCNAAFGPTGICILAKNVNIKTGAVITPVRDDTVTHLLVRGFPANGVFGYGTDGLTVTRVVAVNDGDYGISRFVSTRTLFARDIAIGNDEAGFYVGDSPDADTVVRDDLAFGNQFGVFVRHARQVLVTDNRLTGNCEGIMVLDDGQPGGAGNSVVTSNSVSRNNKFCPKHGETPVNLQGGGILLLGATHTLVAHNSVIGNRGKQINSGGIVVASARPLTHGSNPDFDTIAGNVAFGNRPADLVWDGTGTGVRFFANFCATSIPPGLCR